MYNRFDKSNLDTIKALVQNHLDKLRETTGIKFELGRLTYDSSTFTSTLTAKIAVGKTDFDLKREEYERYCGKFNIPKESFGKTFMFQGEEFQITGIKKYAERFPIIAQKASNGKEYGFQASVSKTLK
jgi:hypothetical protein